MAGPLIWNGLNAKALTRDILLSNAFFNEIRVGNQFSHNSSTGVESGGVLSINGVPGVSVLFDLSAGSGTFIDYTVPTVPTFKSISWNAFTAQTVTGLATQDETYILINNLGAIIQQSNYPTPAQRRTNIFIGRIGHSSRTTIQFATSFPDFSQSVSSQVFDLFDALGPFNVSGNQVSNNGANLQFQKSSGVVFFRSFNYPANTYQPHTINLTSTAPVSFNYRSRNALFTPAVSLIDPTTYDNAGSVVTGNVPNPGSTATIQRVYLAPNNIIQVQYGQTLYPNLASAVASIGTDPFIQNPALTNVTILIAYIVVQKNCLSLADTNTSAILRAPKFETGVGGGVNTVTNLQQAYNSSVQPQIVLAATQGGLQIFDNSTPLGTTLLQVANNAGTTNFFSVNSSGISTALAVGVGTTTTYTHIVTPVVFPGPGTAKVYVKSDNKVYIQDPTGLELLVGPSVGSAAFQAIAGETLVAGDAVYIASTADTPRTAGQAYKLDVTNANRIEFVGIVTTGAAPLVSATIATAGKVTGLSGFLTGQPVFASTTTPGAFQLNAPTVIGQYIMQVGVADSTTSMVINGALSATAILVTEGVSTNTTVENTNFVTFGNFENNALTGWSLFNTTLTSLIPTGGITAGAASITTFATTTSNPLAGTYSLNAAASTSWLAGQGFISDALPISNDAKAKVLTFSFDYQLVSGTGNFSGTSSNTLAVYIFDVSNAVWIQPAGVYNLVQSSGVGLATGTFQTSVNGASYRIAVLAVNSSGAPISMLFDQFAIGQNLGTSSVAPKAPTIQKFTTGSGTYTTPSGVVYIKVRMVGGGGGGGGSGNSPTATAGTGGTTTFGGNTANGGFAGLGNTTPQTAATATLGSGAYGTALSGSLGGSGVFCNGAQGAPAGGVGGTTPFGGAGSPGQPNGTWAGLPAASNTGSGGGGGSMGNAISGWSGQGGAAGAYIDAIINQPIASYSYSVGAGGTAGIAGTGGAAGGAGSLGYIEVTEYYLGNNVVLSADTDTRVVAAAAYRSSTSQAVSGASDVKIQWNGVTKDSHGTFDSTTNYRYTVPVSGTYEFSGTIGIGTSAAAAHMYLALYKNGAAYKNVGELLSSTTATVLGTFSVQDDAKAGDYYEVYINPNSQSFNILSNANILGGSQWNIYRLSGPAVIAATETVACRYTTSSTGPFSVTITPIVFTVKDYDTHNAFGGTFFTAPISGKYSLKVLTTTNSVTPSATNNNINLYYQKNSGTDIRLCRIPCGTTLSSSFCQGGSDDVQLLAGETIRITMNANDTITMNSSAADNHIAIARVGN